MNNEQWTMSNVGRDFRNTNEKRNFTEKKQT